MASNRALSHKHMGGLKVTNLGTPTDVADATTKAYVDAEIVSAKARSNHTGQQAASTISNFDTQVRTSRLDQMGQPTGTLAMNSQRIANLGSPVASSDAATKFYVDDALSSVTGGQTLRGTARVVSMSNVPLANPGATIDGVAMTGGDKVILAGQTDGTENGVYGYFGASSEMTRDTDTLAPGDTYIITEGTSAESFAIVANDASIDYTGAGGTASFAIITASGNAKRYSVTCPSVTAGNTWTVTHNFNTTDVLASVYDSSTGDEVDVAIVAPQGAPDTIEVKPDVSMASGAYYAVVLA